MPKDLGIDSNSQLEKTIDNLKNDYYLNEAKSGH